MYILTGILMFVIGSIIAACGGDFSGLEVIVKFVGGAVLVLAIMWLFTQPVLLIVIALIVIIAMCCAGSSK